MKLWPILAFLGVVLALAIWQPWKPATIPLAEPKIYEATFDLLQQGGSKQPTTYRLKVTSLMENASVTISVRGSSFDLLDGSHVWKGSLSTGQSQELIYSIIPKPGAQGSVAFGVAIGFQRSFADSKWIVLHDLNSYWEISGDEVRISQDWSPEWQQGVGPVPTTFTSR